MTGLLPRVEAHCLKTKIKLFKNDPRIKITSTKSLFTLKGFEPRNYQNQAVASLISKGRAGAEMVTGSGKSLTMALLIQALQLRTLVIVPNLTLRDQLRATFLEVFGSLDNILVENIDSPILKTATDYDVLILDETHHSASQTYRKLNATAWKGIYYRFFFSGTFFRSRDEESMLLEGISGTPCYRFDYLSAVKTGAIVPVESYYYSLPKREMEGNRTNWASVYSELVVNNKYRNELIACLLGRLHREGVSTLCLVKEIKHGQILSDLTFFPFANGQDGLSKELIKAFNSREVRTLIATTGVCGEGVDTKPAEYIIMAAGGKAKTQFMQHVGRGLRKYNDKESAKIILFKDSSHKYLTKHFNACSRYLAEDYGVVPTQLTID